MHLTPLYLRAALSLFIAAGLYGLVIPSLVSSADTLAVIAGLVLLLASPLLIYRAIWREPRPLVICRIICRNPGATHSLVEGKPTHPKNKGD